MVFSACSDLMILLSRLALKPGKVRDTLNWSLLMYIIENYLLFPSNFLLWFCIFLCVSYNQIVHYHFLIIYILQVSTLAKAIRVLASMEEPIGQVLKRTEVRNSYSKTNISVLKGCGSMFDLMTTVASSCQMVSFWRRCHLPLVLYLLYLSLGPRH